MDKTKQRAPLFRPYWTLMESEEGKTLVQKVIERGDPFDDRHFASGNYYLTKKEASDILAKQAREHRLEQNREYSKKHYWAKKAGGAPKGNMRPVRQLTLDGKIVAAYKSIREASKATGISVSSISKACSMGYKTRDYIWERL